MRTLVGTLSKSSFLIVIIVYYYPYFNYSLGIGHTSNQEVVKQIVAEAKAHLVGVSSATIRGKSL